MQEVTLTGFLLHLWLILWGVMIKSGSELIIADQASMSWLVLSTGMLYTVASCVQLKHLLAMLEGCCEPPPTLSLC